VSEWRDGAGGSAVSNAGGDAVSGWCDGARGSAVSDAGDHAVSQREYRAGRATVPAGDDSMSEWRDGAGGSAVSGSAGDRYMLGRQHRPQPLEMPGANTFVAAVVVPIDEVPW
jgi:hypothetical protein